VVGGGWEATDWAADDETSIALGGASRSAGCRAGRISIGLSTCKLARPCISSLYPISPRFTGKGSACGREPASEVLAFIVIVAIKVEPEAMGDDGTFDAISWELKRELK
jgi:hypothetical protein